MQGSTELCTFGELCVYFPIFFGSPIQSISVSAGEVKASQAAVDRTAMLVPPDRCAWERQHYKHIGACSVLIRVEALLNLTVSLGDVSYPDAHGFLGHHAEAFSPPGVESWRCHHLQFSRETACFFRNCVLGEKPHGSTVALSARSVVCCAIWLDSVRG